MKPQQRRGAEGDGDFANSAWIEEERPESAEQSVARRQVGCPSATTGQNNQLLPEHEILGDHRSHAAGATELGRRDGQAQQHEQQVPHVRVSVSQTSRAVQRCAILAARSSIQRQNSQFETDRRSSIDE